ncbi:dirigent protein, partial [Staphylococcus warneri]
KLKVPSAAGERESESAWLKTTRLGNGNTTTLHFYVHDVRAGPNATLYGVANSSITATSATSFGQINVFDDRVTAEADINSEEVARAQGLTTSSDLQIRAVTMNLNFLLKSGEYNGSVISIAGRNQVGDPQRELTVVGGAGAFRYARGYAITSTYANDVEANYSILEYTIYVTTYSDAIAAAAAGLSSAI